MSDFKQRWRWLLAAGAMVGCGNGSVKEPEPIQQEASLTQFAGNNACQDLERYLEDTAVMQMRTQIEASRDQVPSWGWWGGRFGGPLLGVEDSRGGPVPTAAPGGAAPMPTNFTTTNNQVAGVDEADFVKNDGNRIFALSGETLYMSKSWPAADLSLQGKITIEGYPREMFLEGTDKAVVFSSIYQWYPLSNAGGARCSSLNCGYYNANAVKVTVLDVSNLSQPRVSKEFYLPGHYNSARKVGSSVRLVLSDDFNLPPGMKWWPEQTVFTPNSKPAPAAFDALVVENEKLIRQQTLADWVPAATVKENGQSLAVPHPCGDFARVNAPTRLGTVSVATLNLANGGISRTSIIAEPGEIYASQQNLYVATRHWWWWPRPGQRDTTYLHKFDISNPDSARYLASGTVDGHIVDQFSLDESASGHLRVATTIASRVADTENPNNWWGRLETVSRVTVLGQQGRRLSVTGRSEDLAPGERVMSSRFLGDKGFVVTFRQVDPLFTFDLSDPTNPQKLGELKIPGFSTYMHPIDNNHLLTIGTYQPEPGSNGQVDWRSRALQLAIFDVTDMRNPRQTHVQLVGTSSSYSEAQHEHKAFNYFAAKKLLAIPFIDWSYSYRNSNEYWNSFVSDLRVYDVNVQRGFTPKGAVSMADLYRRYSYDNWYYYYTPSVRRSVMADDYVYAISDSGLRVAHISNLSAPLATVPFERYVQR